MNSIIVAPMKLTVEGTTVNFKRGSLVNVNKAPNGNFVIESSNRQIEVPNKLRESFLKSVASLKEFNSRPVYKDYSLVEALSLGASVKDLTVAAYNTMHVKSKKFEGKYSLRVLERVKQLSVESFSKEAASVKTPNAVATSITVESASVKDVKFSDVKSQLTGLKVESSKEFVEFVNLKKSTAKKLSGLLQESADTYLRESKVIVRKNGFTETDMNQNLLMNGYYEMEDEDMEPTHDTQQQDNADMGSDQASDERNDDKKQALGQCGDTETGEDYKSESDDGDDDEDDMSSSETDDDSDEDSDKKTETDDSDEDDSEDDDTDSEKVTEDDEQDKVTNQPDGTDDPSDNNANDGETNDVKVTERVLNTFKKSFKSK